MPLRILLRYLVNNEALVQKLSESYPMRRAAQLTAYVFHRGKDLSEEAVEKLKESELPNRLQQEAQEYGHRSHAFRSTFSREVKNGFKQLNEQIKEQQRKQS